ncbi:unnamed protein product [Brassica oleracea]
MTSNRGTDIFLAGGSDHGTAVKFKTAESMFPSADQSSKGYTSIFPAAFETEGMVESNYDAASKLTGGRNSHGSII